MNNQITIIDNQNQTINVDCICYFLNNKNNKKYLFYTKNEIVQDGLIKMYVAEENNGVINEITLEEWNDLKLIMQDIIKGVGNNITNLPVSGTTRLGGEKVIALNQANIDAIKNSYKNDPKVLAQQSVGSNKDLLSQSFGNSMINESVQEPVSLPQTEIPSVQNQVNNSDLEASSVNLSMTPSIDFNVNDLNVDSSVNTNSTSNQVVDKDLNQDVFQMPNISSINDVNVGSSVSNTTSVNTDTVAENINNEFKVSSAPNIFDLPIEEENTFDKNASNEVKEIENVSSLETNLGSTMSTDVSQNVIEENPIVPNVTELKSDIESSMSVEANDGNLDNDILEARIALEKSNYKLFMNLAENSKKMAELLEKQNKRKRQETNLENTASDLFNSNGALDEDKVLGIGGIAA